VHRARRHLIMVRHQPHVIAVIATEFDHIIGKALAAGEMLFSRRETAAHRMTAGINDCGIGQDQSGQPRHAASC
jgi:hypothetical protein